MKHTRRIALPASTPPRAETTRASSRPTDRVAIRPLITSSRVRARTTIVRLLPEICTALPNMSKRAVPAVLTAMILFGVGERLGAAARRSAQALTDTEEDHCCQDRWQ